MTLPKVQYVIFDLEVPSMKKTFKFRPFLVKEEKILLTAQQSGDIKEMILALKQIINNCCQDSLAHEELSLLDIEYLFLKLRSKSVNNIVEITIKDPDDEKEVKVKIDLEDVKIVYNPEHKEFIQVDQNIKLHMRYPNVDILDKVQAMLFDVSMFFDVIKYCIQTVEYQGTNLKFSDYSDEEIQQFIEQINIDGFNQITAFFDTMPKMRHEIKYKNSLDMEKTIVLETLADFFILG